MEPALELIARPDAVWLDLVATSREGALKTLHGRLAAEAGVADRDRFLFDLLERVQFAGVCIAPDVALPHARTPAVNRLVLGVARLAAPGVAFDPEHPQVRLMFLVGVPKEAVDVYLQAVASISRLLKTDGAREALLAAPDEAAFRDVLAGGVRA